MKKLYIIRHAKSSWDQAGLRDFDRPLNNRGYIDAPFMAKVLKNMSVSPDLLVSSPANRAITTAGYFSNEFDIQLDRILQKPELYEAYPSDIMRVVAALPDEHNTVLLFGHNPGLTMLVNQFTKNYLDNLPTCGVARLEGTATSWADFSSKNTMVTGLFFPKDLH